MYRNWQYRIYGGHPLYEWCSDVCHDANDLENAVLFLYRNLFTALHKQPEKRHPLENEVLTFIESGVKLANIVSKENTLKKWDETEKGPKPDISELEDKYTMPTLKYWFISSELMIQIMRHMNHPNYNTGAISANGCQRIIRQVRSAMAAAIANIKEYSKNPGKFLGRPGLPRYNRKGGMATMVYASDGIHYNDNESEDGSFSYSVTLPKQEETLKIGGIRPNGKIKELRIVPHNGFFVIHIVTDDGMKCPNPADALATRRIAAIDLGVDNLASIVNNCGLPCLIFKGTPLKAVNQWTSKNMAEIQSEQTKGGDKKFVMTDEAYELQQYRSDYVHDFLLKASKRIVGWCVENRIDTLVIGYNAGWKQESNMGKQSNQNFYMIPFLQFVEMLEWRCEREGILCVRQEESYTSKASFQDRDFIPVYGEEKPEGGWKFSGYRKPMTRYYRPDGNDGIEMYKVKPRGLYKSRKYGVINSDLNGAANSLWKAFPGAFWIPGASAPDFSSVIVFSHPDEVLDRVNHERQLSVHGHKSKAKSHRDAKRAARAACPSSPSGIGLCE